MAPLSIWKGNAACRMEDYIHIKTHHGCKIFNTTSEIVLTFVSELESQLWTSNQSFISTFDIDSWSSPFNPSEMLSVSFLIRIRPFLNIKNTHLRCVWSILTPILPPIHDIITTSNIRNDKDNDVEADESTTLPDKISIYKKLIKFLVKCWMMKAAPGGW